MSLSFFQQVQPKAGTPGVVETTGDPAPAGQAAPPAPSMTPTLIMMAAVLVPFLFLSMRRSKKEREARAGMKKGDRVLTGAGLIGELVELDERIGKVKIAPGTTVQVLASSLSPFETPSEKKADKSLEDLKEAKATASDKK